MDETQTRGTVRQTVRQLNRLDLEFVDFEDVIQMIRSLIPGTRVTVGLTASTEWYFRARICNSMKPRRINELGAPPPELVTGYQRCNPPGKPMFYGASKRITALLERDVHRGDTVYLSQWINRKPVPVNRLFASGEDHELTASLTENELILHSYFDTIFTRPVHETFSSVYKVTAAITEVLTTGFNPNDEHDIRSDSTVGLVYPSVVNFDGSYNTAFHSAFAGERLQLFHVMELQILERDSKGLKVSVTDNAIEFPDGEIAWLNDPRPVPRLIEDRNSIPFISNGRAWTIPVCNTELTAAQLLELLDE